MDSVLQSIFESTRTAIQCVQSLTNPNRHPADQLLERLTASRQTQQCLEDDKDGWLSMEELSAIERSLAHTSVRKFSAKNT